MVNYVCSGAADLVGRDHADHFCRPQGNRAIKLTCLRLAPFQSTTQDLKTAWHWWGEEDICPKGNGSNVPRKNPVDTCKYLVAQHITDNIVFLNIGKALKTSQRTEYLWMECQTHLVHMGCVISLKALKTSQRTEYLWMECLTHLVHMGCVIWLVFWAFKDMICSSWTSGIKDNTYYCNWTAFQRPNFTTTLRYKGPAPVTTYNFCTFLTV